MSKAYSSHLTEEQFELIKPLIPPAKPGGRPREVDMWEILNGIFILSLKDVSGVISLVICPLGQRYTPISAVGALMGHGSKFTTIFEGGLEPITTVQ